MPDRDTVTICAIVKDELPYLVEWVAYYRLLGFDRLVLYSNDCSDGSDRLLDGMAAAGLVEHRRWPSIPGRSAQKTAYADAVKHTETRWIFFSDADEFLHLAQDRTIRHFLARFPDDVSAIAVNWRVFGSSGRTVRTPEPVIERFTRAAERSHTLNRHVKSMMVAADVHLLGVHGAELSRGRYVQPDGSDVVLHRHAFAPVRHEVAQVNHYVVRSRAEFDEKRRRGDANLPLEAPNKSSTREGSFFATHDRNEAEDRAILERLPALRAEMRRIRRRLARIDPGLVSTARAGRLHGLLRRWSGWWHRPVRCAEPRA